MVSLFSSEASRRAHTGAGPAQARSVAKRLGVLLLVTAAIAMTVGCVTVRPEDKEFLADPAMTFGADGPTQAHDEHVFMNREGSFGAGGVSGGGCGCN